MDGRGCNKVAGAIKIFDIAFDSQGLKHISARAEQPCEGGKTVLYTIVDYDRQGRAWRYSTWT